MALCTLSIPNHCKQSALLHFVKILPKTYRGLVAMTTVASVEVSNTSCLSAKMRKSS